MFDFELLGSQFVTNSLTFPYKLVCACIIMSTTHEYKFITFNQSVQYCWTISVKSLNSSGSRKNGPRTISTKSHDISRKFRTLKTLLVEGRGSKETNAEIVASHLGHQEMSKWQSSSCFLLPQSGDWGWVVWQGSTSLSKVAPFAGSILSTQISFGCVQIIRTNEISMLNKINTISCFQRELLELFYIVIWLYL